MPSAWATTTLASVDRVVEELADLSLKRWIHRGEARTYDALVPSIDREGRAGLTRIEKLALEQRSIQTFRESARFFNFGEEQALQDPIVALMVLRHHGVPTRLLDWSGSPYVAAYFATDHSQENEAKDGQIWSFDEALYEIRGRVQWTDHPETTWDGSGDPARFEAGVTAFARADPPDWFICAFYGQSFPRQHAQQGAYSMTSRFDRDHADAIYSLVGHDACKRFVVPASVKSAIRQILRDDHGIWRGSLFPDSAGAAETARAVFEGLAK
jgi:hypothetical protein